MPKTSQEIEKEFIDNLDETTGKNLNQWMIEIKNSGVGKRNDIIDWLKTEHNFGHMNASLLTGIYTNGGNPVYRNESDLLDNQFEKNKDMRPLYEKLQKAISRWDNAVEFVVKKTYVSVTKKREFAAINIKRGGLRLGLDLGDIPFDSFVQKASLTGPMARISHMVVIHSEDDLNSKLFKLLEESDRRVNP